MPANYLQPTKIPPPAAVPKAITLDLALQTCTIPCGEPRLFYTETVYLAVSIALGSLLHCKRRDCAVIGPVHLPGNGVAKVLSSMTIAPPAELPATDIQI